MVKITKPIVGIVYANTTSVTQRGPDVYAHEIIRRLTQMNGATYVVWSQSDQPGTIRPHISLTWKKIRSHTLWSQARLPFELIFGTHTNVIFIPNHVIPLFGSGTFVVTIHDCAYEFFPDSYSKKEIVYQRFALKSALKKSRSIIVPSLTTKNDIISLYKGNPDKIHVIPHGIDPAFFDVKKNFGHALLGYGISEPYILYTGRLESRKNILILIEAYILLRQEEKIHHKLVLAGSPGNKYTLIEKALTRVPANFRRDIIETGHVTGDTLKVLLAHADIFVMPSLYEGFGISVLEAMAVGIPTIVNDTPSLKEVVGNGALVVPMKKAFPLAAKMSYLIHHPLEMTSLRVKAKRRARMFTWEKSASQTFDVLMKAIDR